MEKITIHVHEAQPDTVINEALHGQFIEFLGQCIHEGLWVGRDSKIENIDGIRKDVLDALKQLQPPVIRWPGGCYADTYHWRDGVGAKRKTVWNENFGTYEAEDNGFGTHEFMELCEYVGAKPWLNVNMMSGSVAEMREWAEYCNRKEETDLSLERAQNGHPAPFNVEYWGIGNEAWCGGGNYTAQSYAGEYRKYASALPAFKPSIPFKEFPGPDMKCIASGPDGNKPIERKKWTQDLFKSWSEYRMPPLYGMDLHFYNWNLKNMEQDETDFDTQDWYRVLNGCLELEEVIDEQTALIKEGLSGLPQPEGDLPGSKVECKLIVGEWGNWHGKAFFNRPALYQQATMLDALCTALTLDIFHRHCDQISMACAAQSINVLNSLVLTHEDQMLLTPNYDVFKMYKVHRNAALMQADCDAQDLAECSRLKQVHALASQKENEIFVNLVNAEHENPVDIELHLPHKAAFEKGEVLASAHLQDHNTFENPNKVRAQAKKDVLFDENKKAWKVILPPASVCTFHFRIA